MPPSDHGFQSRWPAALPALGTLCLAASLAACGPASGSWDSDWESTAEQDGAIRVCAQGSTVKGIDVSKYQGDVSWSKVSQAGIGFAFIRVSYGSGSLDPKFAANWSGARKAGMARGAYQYFLPDQDPIAQAQVMIHALAADDTTSLDLPPVLDVEEPRGMSASTVRDRVQRWLDAVQAATGRRPLIYSAAFMQDTLGTGFGDYPLWVANYTSNCPLLPNGWSDWVFWQYSDQGSVPGIPGGVDLDRFNGTVEDLLAFANGEAGAPSDSTGPATDDPLPATPGGLRPANNQVVKTDSVKLQCDPFAGASQYDFEIQYKSSTWKAYYRYTTSAASKTFWPSTDAPYRFRARARTSSGWTPMSAWSYFIFAP